MSLVRSPRKNKLPPLPEHVDTLVVGAGLTGLATAALHAKQGKSILLVDAQGAVGGRWSPEEREGLPWGTGFSFGDAMAWQKLFEALGQSHNFLHLTNGQALEHSAKGWEEVNFADSELPAWEKYFARECAVFPQGGYWGLTRALFETLLGYAGENSVALHAPVTAVQCTEGKALYATIGATAKLEFSQCIWAANWKSLLEVLQGEGLPESGPARVAWLQRQVKSTAQPGVVLEFVHKKSPCEFMENLILPLPAGEKEERRFVVGSVVSNRDPSLATDGKAVSSWIFPLRDQEWGDNHETMKRIRAARRAMEKAIPDFEKTILHDRVLVLESTATPLAKAKSATGPLLDNFFCASDWAIPAGATPEAAVEHALGTPSK